MNNVRAIYFDMDGTIANLYADAEWLIKLRNQNPAPYKTASPLLNMRVLARTLNKLQKSGYVIGIVSWLSKVSTPQYDEAVTNAKLSWLHKHIGSVAFNEVHIIPYGTPKQSVVHHPCGILFDDEDKNRKEWRGRAYEPADILNILRALK